MPLGPALGKDCLCRVPDRKHSAKLFALGKSAVSGSVGAVAWGATSKLAFSLMLDLNVDARMATNLSSST